MTCSRCGSYFHIQTPDGGVYGVIPLHTCEPTTEGIQYVPPVNLGVDARFGRCHTILADGMRCHDSNGHVGGCWRWAEI